MRVHPFVSVLLASLLGASAAFASPGGRPVIATGKIEGASVSAARVVAKTSARDAAAAARLLLQKNVQGASEADLGQAREARTGRGERVVKLPQIHRGVPVLSRGVSVTFASEGAARLLGAHLLPESELPASVLPQISADDAVQSASRSRGMRHHRSARAKLAIWPGATGARLVWVVRSVAKRLLPTQPVVLIDAVSGEIILSYNAARNLNRARVFASNPVTSPALSEVVLKRAAGEQSLISDQIVAANCVDLQSSYESYEGFDVHMCDPLHTVEPDDSGDFYAYVPPSDHADPEDAFSELSLFHHAQRAAELFEGFAPGLLKNDGGVVAIANYRVPVGYSDDGDCSECEADPAVALKPYPNAFFIYDDPDFESAFGFSGGVLASGQGYERDFSYDGDVVYHEMGHAAVHWTAGLVATPHLDAFGVSVAPGAMDEGLSDYFSSVLTGDPHLGEYIAGELTGGAYLRSLEAPDACPGAIAGETHQDATLFSGALWDMRKTLSAGDASVLDAAIFSAMMAAPSGDLGYEDMATLIVAEVKASSLGDAGASALEQSFGNRGVLPGCTRILDYDGTALFGPAEYNGTWELLGTETTGLRAPLGFSPGVFQVRSQIAEGARSVTVSLVGGSWYGDHFDPVVLVRFGSEPITFTYKPYAVAEGTRVIKPTGELSQRSASFEVPAGATEMHVMVANGNAYDAWVFELSIESGAGSSPGEADSELAAGDGDDGCGCAVPGASAPVSGAAAGLLAALGLMLSRRRR